MKTIRIASFFIFLLWIWGCAPVNFYSDPALTIKTGIKFHPVKPFIQVEKEAGSGRIVKATVIYLPDLSNPQFMSVRSGPGAAKADLKLDEGLLSSFGFQSERILPETIESLGTLISKTGAGLEDIYSLKGVPPLNGVANTIQIYEVVMRDGKTSLIEVVPE